MPTAQRRLPWVMWFPTDWLGDVRVQRAPLDVRGAWFEILNHMFHEGTDTIAAPLAEFATGIFKTSPAKARTLINEIEKRAIADVAQDKNLVIITSRRIARERQKKAAANTRQRRNRRTAAE